MTKIYYELFFAQDEAAQEYLDMLHRDGEKKVLKHIIDMGVEDADSFKVSETKPWGENDRVYKQGKYYLTYNINYGYIGVCALEKNM